MPIKKWLEHISDYRNIFKETKKNRNVSGVWCNEVFSKMSTQRVHSRAKNPTHLQRDSCGLITPCEDKWGPQKLKIGSVLTVRMRRLVFFPPMFAALQAVRLLLLRCVRTSRCIKQTDSFLLVSPKTWHRTRGCGGRCWARSPRSPSWCGTPGRTRAAETNSVPDPLHGRETVGRRGNTHSGCQHGSSEPHGVPLHVVGDHLHVDGLRLRPKRTGVSMKVLVMDQTAAVTSTPYL